MRVWLGICLMGLAGCAAAAAPALELRESHRVGPLTILLAPAPEVDYLCGLSLGTGRTETHYVGCYLPNKQTIVSTPDPRVLLHEFRHYFEGKFHR